MIVIFSSEFDESTFWVIKWLKKFKAKVIRINSFNESADTLLELLSQDDKVSSVWFRRTHAYTPPYFDEAEVIQQKFFGSLTQEVKNFNDYLFYQLRDAQWINHPSQGNINKLIALSKAKAVGLPVPAYIITNNKKVLLEFQQQHGKIISKPIANINPITYEDNRFIPYTQILEPAILASLPDQFFISLFQGYIDKKFEIRSFYLDGKFYSMAIMSQQNSMTKEDFRNYDFDNPNRFLPYQLPEAIETKLVALMDQLGLNSGSIDIIRANDGQFYFLEVNPVGQFGMVSLPCNYHLEKIIAQKLYTSERNN